MVLCWEVPSIFCTWKIFKHTQRWPWPHIFTVLMKTPQVKLVSCKSLKAKKHHMEAHQPASQPFTDTIVCNLLLFFSELKQQFLFFFKKKVFLGMTLDGWWWAVMMSRELKIVRLTTDRWMNISQNIVNRRNDHVRRCVSLVAQLSLG